MSRQVQQQRRAEVAKDDCAAPVIAGVLEVVQAGAEALLGLGKVAQPIRVAVSGGTVSPPIFESLEFLKRERTLARLDRCLGTL